MTHSSMISAVSTPTDTRFIACPPLALEQRGSLEGAQRNPGSGGLGWVDIRTLLLPDSAPVQPGYSLSH